MEFAVVLFVNKMVSLAPFKFVYCALKNVAIVFIYTAFNTDDKKELEMKVSVDQPKKAKDNTQQEHTQTPPLTKLKRPQLQSMQASKLKTKENSSTSDQKKARKLNKLKEKTKQGKKSTIHAAYVQASDMFLQEKVELKKRLEELQKRLSEAGALVEV